MLFTSTAAPERSLNTPELTTSCPALTPSVTAILGRRAAHGPPRSEEAKEGVAAFKEKRKPSWYPQ